MNTNLKKEKKKKKLTVVKNGCDNKIIPLVNTFISLV